MCPINLDIEIFPGKKLNDLFKDIYNNQLNKKVRIDSFIAEVRQKIKTKDDIHSLLPIINDMMKESVKNDEHLIKLSQVVQRIIASEQRGQGEGGGFSLTEEEKEQLIKSVNELEHSIAVEVIDSEIDSIKKDYNI
jgi:3-dehydroquinate dehydratase